MQGTLEENPRLLGSNPIYSNLIQATPRWLGYEFAMTMENHFSSANLTYFLTIKWRCTQEELKVSFLFFHFFFLEISYTVLSLHGRTQWRYWDTYGLTGSREEFSPLDSTWPSAFSFYCPSISTACSDLAVLCYALWSERQRLMMSWVPLIHSQPRFASSQTHTQAFDLSWEDKRKW